MLIIQSKIIEFDQKWLNLIKNCQFWSSFRSNSTIFDQIRQFRYKFEFEIEIQHGFQIEIVMTIDRTGKFGSRKSIRI